MIKRIGRLDNGEQVSVELINNKGLIVSRTLTGDDTEFSIYDDLNRLIKVYNHSGFWCTYEYNADGTIECDSEGNSKTLLPRAYMTDTEGDKVTKILCSKEHGIVTETEVNGNLTNFKTEGLDVGFIYGLDGRLESKLNMDGQLITYEYIDISIIKGGNVIED